MSFCFSQNFFCDFHSVWRLQFWVRKTPYIMKACPARHILVGIIITIIAVIVYSTIMPTRHVFGLVGLINAVMGTSWHLRHEHHRHQHHHHCTLYSAYRWRSESVISVWRLHPDNGFIFILDTFIQVITVSGISKFLKIISRFSQLYLIGKGFNLYPCSWQLYPVPVGYISVLRGYILFLGGIFRF